MVFVYSDFIRSKWIINSYRILSVFSLSFSFTLCRFCFWFFFSWWSDSHKLLAYNSAIRFFFFFFIFFFTDSHAIIDGYQFKLIHIAIDLHNKPIFRKVATRWNMIRNQTTCPRDLLSVCYFFVDFFFSVFFFDVFFLITKSINQISSSLSLIYSITLEIMSNEERKKNVYQKQSAYEVNVFL